MWFETENLSHSFHAESVKRRKAKVDDEECSEKQLQQKSDLNMKLVRWYFHVFDFHFKVCILAYHPIKLAHI